MLIKPASSSSKAAGAYSKLKFPTICCSVVAISLWLYIRYAGEHHELSRWLELVADFIWENLMGQVYDSLVEKATHELSNKVMRDAGLGAGGGSKKKTS